MQTRDSLGYLRDFDSFHFSLPFFVFLFVFFFLCFYVERIFPTEVALLTRCLVTISHNRRADYVPNVIRTSRVRGAFAACCFAVVDIRSLQRVYMCSYAYWRIYLTVSIMRYFLSQCRTRQVIRSLRIKMLIKRGDTTVVNSIFFCSRVSRGQC